MPSASMPTGGQAGRPQWDDAAGGGPATALIITADMTGLPDATC
jgi:hypothetical protein